MKRFQHDKNERDIAYVKIKPCRRHRRILGGGLV